MASGVYNRFKANLMNKEIDLEADTIKVALLNNSHSFTATHNTWSEVSANELAATGGYTTGGVALSGKSVTQGATTKFDATDFSVDPATWTAYHCVLYDDSMANDDLICSFDFGGAKQVISGRFAIAWSSSGIITLA